MPPLNFCKYAQLLAASLPVVPSTKRDHARLLKVVEGLMRGGKRLSREEEALLRLFALLIEDYERRTHRPAATTPQDALRELMAANGLRQCDLVPAVFGHKSVISEVLSGKRGISKTQAKALATLFNVTTDIFI